AFERGEVNHYRLARLGVAYVSQHAVAGVLRMAFDVALSCEFVAPFGLDGEMDVRRAAGVRDGLDRAEQVFSGRTGQEPSETLKVRVAFVAVDTARMNVRAAVVALPDFDQRAAHRLAARVQYPPAQVSHCADGGRGAVVDYDQVVVGVERHLVGVKRPLGLARRLDQLLCEDSWLE